MPLGTPAKASIANKGQLQLTHGKTPCWFILLFGALADTGRIKQQERQLPHGAEGR